MAVKLINMTRRYIGDETDDKPTEEVPNGSEFYEFDSTHGFLRAVYMFYDGEWKDI